MGQKQIEILAWAKSVGGFFTKKECVEHFKGEYYHNAQKHIGDRITRLIHCGLLIRVQPGKYKLSKGTKAKPSTIPDNQQTLF